MATWQHLRSSTANKRPTTSLADGRIAINTNTASPGLFFKDSAGTGIVKVGPVHVGTTAPNSVPASGGSTGNYTGEQWLDTSVSPAQMKVWNGSTWVGIVADELPVSKLQDGAARQLIQTDAAGTGVEWTSNVDVPGTLDVTSTATFDSIAQHPLGTAGAPTVTFTGDTNTGLYSPGADQVAISTNGVQRINIEADGDINIDSGGVFYDATNNRLAIGTTTVTQRCEIGAGSEATNYLRIHGSTSDLYIGSSNTGTNLGITDGTKVISVDAYPFAIGTTVGQPVILGTDNLERARIDSSGRLLVGTSSSVSVASLEANQQIFGSAPQLSIIRGSNNASGATLALAKSRNTAIGSRTIVSDGDTMGSIRFCGDDGVNLDAIGAQIAGQVDGTPGAGDLPSRLVFSTTADGASSPTERMRISSNGSIRTGNTITYTGATGAVTATTGTIVFSFDFSGSTTRHTAMIRLSVMHLAATNDINEQAAAEYLLATEAYTTGVVAATSPTAVFQNQYVAATHFAFASTGNTAFTITLTEPTGTAASAVYYKVEILDNGSTCSLTSVATT
jgi:hypothetical protein